MLGFLHQFIYSVHCLGFKWTLSNKIFWWDKGMPSQTENVIEVYVAVIFNGFKIQSWKCSIQGQRFRGKGGTPECTLCRRENKPTPSGVGCLQGTMPWVFRLAPLPLSHRLPGQAARYAPGGLALSWGLEKRHRSSMAAEGGLRFLARLCPPALWFLTGSGTPESRSSYWFICCF